MATVDQKQRTPTTKQRRFVEEYLVDLNATQAAIRAGYSEKTANVIASQLLAKLNIQQAVAQKRDELAKATAVTAERILNEYRRIAYANITDAIEIRDGAIVVQDTDSLTDDQKAAISEIAETKDGLRVKFHSKVHALDSLAKHLGMFTEKVSVAHSGTLDVAIVADVARSKLQRIVELADSDNQINDSEPSDEDSGI